MSCLTFLVHILVGSCTGGMCHFSCGVYAVCCFEYYLFCRKIDYGLMEYDFVCLTFDTLINILMKALYVVFLQLDIKWLFFVLKRDRIFFPYCMANLFSAFFDVL